MTEVVEWRVNITEPRHMTGTWQNRPSKFNGKQLNFYALRILYSSASRYDIH